MVAIGGYAHVPGEDPDGATCAGCRHIRTDRKPSVRYECRKASQIAGRFCGFIRASSPACKYFGWRDRSGRRRLSIDRRRPLRCRRSANCRPIRRNGPRIVGRPGIGSPTCGAAIAGLKRSPAPVPSRGSGISSCASSGRPIFVCPPCRSPSGPPGTWSPGACCEPASARDGMRPAGEGDPRDDRRPASNACWLQNR